MASSFNTQWLNSATEQLKGLRVLLVDDNLEYLRTVQMLVEVLGCEVSACSEAEQCLDNLEQFRPDVALLDVALPGTDGIELSRLIRARAGFEDLKIVAVSGYSEQQVRRSVGDGQIDAFLCKPVSLETLHATLLSCTSVSQSEPQESTAPSKP